MLEAFKNVELENIFKKISSIGYDGVEFFVSKGNSHVDLDSFNDDIANNLKKMLGKFNLKALAICNSHEAQLILGPHDEATDHLFKGSAEDKIKYGMTRIKKTIEVAEKLGVFVITVFSGAPDWGKWYPFPDLNADIWKKYFNLFAERWLPILDYANKHKVKLAFEGEPGNLNYNLETSLQLLESVNYHPSMGICYDPSHIFWQGIDPVNYIYEIKDRIYNVHMKDVEVLNFRKVRTGILAPGPMNLKARTFRFRIPGWGDLPWKKIISALYEVGYKGPFIVELEDPLISLDKGLREGYNFTKQILSVLYGY